MSAEQQSHSDKPEPNSPDDAHANRERNLPTYRGSKLSSSTAAFRRSERTTVEYVDVQPSSPDPSMREPTRKVPLVPTGPQVSDAADPRAVDFANPDDAANGERKAGANEDDE